MRRCLAVSCRPLRVAVLCAVVSLYSPPAFALGEGNVQKEVGEPGSFQLQPGDRLEILVYREEDLSGVYEVDPGGQLTFPLVGEIQVVGLGVDELRAALTLSLRRYLVNPQVSISRSEGAIKSISILGDVTKPGAYDYTPRATLMRLISRAGGFAPTANKKKIKIVRMVKGEKEVVVVNGSNIINGEEDDPDIKPGDIVFVPESIF